MQNKYDNLANNEHSIKIVLLFIIFLLFSLGGPLLFGHSFKFK